MRSMKLGIVATAYGLWLFGLVEVFYLTNGNADNALEFTLMAGAIPAAMQFFMLGVDPLGLVTPVKFSLVLVLIILLSYFGSSDDWTPLIQACNVTFVLGIAVLVAGSPDERLLPALAAVCSLFTGIMLVYVNFTGEYIWGRLAAHHIQPNFWGTIGLAVALASLGARRFPLILFGVGAGLLTLYDASARGSLVGLLAAFAALLILAGQRLRDHRLVTVLVGAGVLLVVGMVASTYVSGLADLIWSDVFKGDDPYRGLGSGLTGRTELWEETLDVWIKSPLFGVGYHQHQNLVSSVGSHNAYLAMLADTGIFSLLLYAWLLIRSFLAALAIKEPRLHRLIVGYVAGYAVYGFFEARAFNNGNPLSLLFLMCCFYALTHAARRRVARSAPSASPAGIHGDAAWRGSNA
jgi:O-antigen ligase